MAGCIFRKDNPHIPNFLCSSIINLQSSIINPIRPPSPKSRYRKEEIETVKSVGLTPLFHARRAWFFSRSATPIRKNKKPKKISAFFVERIKLVDFYGWMYF
jgi:hypothetical protein